MTTGAQPPPTFPALQSAWQDVILQLKAQLDPTIFNAYIRDTHAVSLADGVLVVSASSAYTRDWCNSRLGSMSSRQVAPLLGQPVQVKFVYQEPQNDGAEQGRNDSKVEVITAVQREAQSHQAGVTAKAASPQHSSDRTRPTAGLQQPAVESPSESLPAADISSSVIPHQMDTDLELDPESESCGTLLLEEAADSIEAALLRPGRIVAFPRYELRFLPLVGPENFFLRLAFLQERYLHTSADNRAQPFETSVESLLRWANVGRATLHRFKKGDAARGQAPAAGWFGIEQLPSARRNADSQQQPPCRYRMQMGIPLTPMDADRLRDLLADAGICNDPLQALQALCERPIQEILDFPPPPPDESQRRRAPVFSTVTQVVQSALGSGRMTSEQRAKIADWTARLSDHITMPHQLVHVSWYFLREWLPQLGHDAAALVLYTRAQGYYNPQTHELRDEIRIAGGYGELARAIGLKRDRTIGDWLPNIFDSKPRRASSADDKWLREQQRQQQAQERIARFVQVVPDSRQKTPEGHYAFHLHVEITSDPLTQADACLRDWVQHTLAASAQAGVLEHYLAWVQSKTMQQRAQEFTSAENDGRGILGGQVAENQNDVWGILAARQERQQKCEAGKMTARESQQLRDDGWGILEAILFDGWGILATVEMTARELFKGLLRLTTYWESIQKNIETTPEPTRSEAVVVAGWNIAAICRRNGGINAYRAQIIAQNGATEAFLSWLLYAYSFKGRGINDPVGWALARLREHPGAKAEGVYQRLAGRSPAQISRLLQQQIQSGAAPADPDWKLAFRETPLPRLRELAETLGLQPELG